MGHHQRFYSCEFLCHSTAAQLTRCNERATPIFIYSTAAFHKEVWGQETHETGFPFSLVKISYMGITWPKGKETWGQRTFGFLQACNIGLHVVCVTDCSDDRNSLLLFYVLLMFHVTLQLPPYFPILSFEFR